MKDKDLGRRASAEPALVASWCAACNVPVGVGACRTCRETAWTAILEQSRPKREAQPDTDLFAMALSVGMGAAAHIVQQTWGKRYAQCVLDYIAEFDAKRKASADTHPQGGDSAQTEAPFMSGAVPSEETADAKTPSLPTGDDNV